MNKTPGTSTGIRKKLDWEPFVFLLVFLSLFAAIAVRMGVVNMINTLMNTAYSLLMDTVFYIMAIAVIAGALGAILSEFGVVALINRLISPLMKPLYDLPGAASVGILTTYLSDNPAILALANDKNFRGYFKKYQVPALTNIGTAFGMGAIITTFIIGIQGPAGENYGLAALVGNLGAVFGSIISTRIMLRFTAKEYGRDDWDNPELAEKLTAKGRVTRVTRGGSVSMRAINSLLDGGKAGVQLGLDIIPGVLIICSMVLILTNGPSESGTYTGAAYEGIAFFPWLAGKISFILKPLFGFTSTECISVPITALGSAGAAIALIPNLIRSGAASGADVAVFTSMCMCWSGYLSTHVAMMDSLGANKLTGKAILSHTIGGACAGVFAHWVYTLIVAIF